MSIKVNLYLAFAIASISLYNGAPALFCRARVFIFPMQPLFYEYSLVKYTFLLCSMYFLVKVRLFPAGETESRGISDLEEVPYLPSLNGEKGDSSNVGFSSDFSPFNYPRAVFFLHLIRDNNQTRGFVVILLEIIVVLIVSLLLGFVATYFAHEIFGFPRGPGSIVQELFLVGTAVVLDSFLSLSGFSVSRIWFPQRGAVFVIELLVGTCLCSIAWVAS